MTAATTSSTQKPYVAEQPKQQDKSKVSVKYEGRALDLGNCVAMTPEEAEKFSEACKVMVQKSAKKP